MAAIPQEYRDILKSYPEFEDEEALRQYLEEKDLAITVWTASDLDVDEALLGLSGSPTQVYKVNYVVLETSDSKVISPSLEGIKAMIEELVQEYIVG
jgi:electron transfer flavoprotein beta subunit